MQRAKRYKRSVTHCLWWQPVLACACSPESMLSAGHTCLVWAVLSAEQKVLQTRLPSLLDSHHWGMLIHRTGAVGHDGQEWCHGRERWEPDLERWPGFVSVGQWEDLCFWKTEGRNHQWCDFFICWRILIPWSHLASFNLLFLNVNSCWWICGGRRVRGGGDQHV